jgi:mRNA interferase HigB
MLRGRRGWEGFEVEAETLFIYEVYAQAGVFWRRNILCISPDTGLCSAMRVIAYKTLRDFRKSNPAYVDVIEPARAWFRHALAADWKNPAEIKADLLTANILKDGRVVFNFAGNKYRLVVWINYPFRVVYVRFIGTHEHYDHVDAQTI